MTGSGVAMAGNGDVVAVWTQSSGGVWASIRPAGGSFGAPVPLSSGTGLVGTNRPVLAVDPAGNAVVAWTQSDGTTQRTRAAFRPAGGSFGPMETISAAGESADEPDVAIDGVGNAIAVWSRFDGTRRRVQWSYRPFGGSFPEGTTITAGAASSQEHPRIDMDSAGNAVVAYQAYDTPPNVTYIRYQERPAGGVFPGDPGEKDVPPPDGGNGTGPSFGAMDVALGGGEITLVWVRFEGAASYAYRGAVRTFGAPQSSGSQVLDTSGSMRRIEVVMAPSGAALAAWSTFDGSDVLWAARAPGSAFTPALHLAPQAESAGEVTIGLDGLGNAMATWYQLAPSSGHTAWAARRPAGGSFGASQELFGGGEGIFFSSLSAGGDSQGNAFAAVGRLDSSAGSTRLNVAGWDPVAPRLDALSIPSVGLNPIAFSVSPFDVWGPVSTVWDFGDGSSAAGTQASHAFATPGQSYNVTATATDAAGNSASASGLTVLNAPPTVRTLTMLRRVFAVAGSPTAITTQRRRRARAKRGTAFRYSVSEPARVTIRIDRITPGKRVGTSCRKPTRRLKRRRSCKRYIRAGRTLVRNVPAGKVSTKFSGRIGRRALRPGRYRATVAATDGAGLRSNPRRITFRVVRR